MRHSLSASWALAWLAVVSNPMVVRGRDRESRYTRDGTAAVVESCEGWSASALLSLPFALIGLLSLRPPWAIHSARLLVSLLLLFAATWLAWSGAPRRRRLLLDDGGRVLDDVEERTLFDSTRRLVLTASRNNSPRSPDSCLQILAENAVGGQYPVFSCDDPARAIVEINRLTELLRLPIANHLSVHGKLPLAVRESRHTPTPSLESLLSVVPRHGLAVVWLGWGGALFVWMVAASLVHAHWRRGGSFDASSLLLMFALAAIALVLPWAAYRTRFCSGAVQVGHSVLSQGSTTSPAARRGLVAPSLVGEQWLVHWGQEPDTVGLLSLAPDELPFLVTRVSGAVDAVLLPVPTKDEVTELAPTPDLR